jgi:hypothetical protein
MFDLQATNQTGPSREAIIELEICEPNEGGRRITAHDNTQKAKSKDVLL